MKTIKLGDKKVGVSLYTDDHNFVTVTFTNDARSNPKYPNIAYEDHDVEFVFKDKKALNRFIRYLLKVKKYMETEKGDKDNA